MYVNHSELGIQSGKGPQMQRLSQNISYLVLCCNWKEVCDPSKHLVPNKMAIKLNVLGALVEYRIGNNVQSRLIITIDCHWFQMLNV